MSVRPSIHSSWRIIPQTRATYSCCVCATVQRRTDNNNNNMDENAVVCLCYHASAIFLHFSRAHIRPEKREKCFLDLMCRYGESGHFSFFARFFAPFEINKQKKATSEGYIGGVVIVSINSIRVASYGDDQLGRFRGRKNVFASPPPRPSVGSH